MVMHVSASDFEEDVLKEKGVVVVDFWATWCGPCKMIAPIVEELDEEMSNVKFVKVDVDKNLQIANQYKIVSIPTLKIFKDGKLINTLIGFKTKDALKIDVEACLYNEKITVSNNETVIFLLCYIKKNMLTDGCYITFFYFLHPRTSCYFRIVKI